MPKSNAQLVQEVKEALLALPTDEARLEFVHVLLADVCMICGKVTDSICFCSRDD
jgi:hypothetical protein